MCLVDPSTTSQGGIRFVTAVHTEEKKVDVNYNENSIGIINASPFITEARLHPHVYAPFDGGTTRSGHRRRIKFGGAGNSISNTTINNPRLSCLFSAFPPPSKGGNVGI